MMVLWLGFVVLTLLAISFVAFPVWLDQSDSTKRSNTVLVIVVSLFILTCGIIWIEASNNQEIFQWLQTRQRAEIVKHEIKRLGSRAQIINALQTKLNSLPQNESNAKGWFILGKLLFNENRFEDSLRAVQMAIRLKPNEPEYLLQSVSIKFIIHKHLDAQDKNILVQLLKSSPNNINAMNLLALNAYQEKNYSEAIHRWEQLLSHFPADSQDAKTLLAMIQQARQMQAPTGRQVKVLVDIGSAYKSKIAPGDVLFVYALDESGSKMPLAVVKVPASEIPVTVVLSDSNSMVASHTLSTAKRILIKARISKSGQAMPAKGEYMGYSDALELGKSNTTITVTIDKTL